VLKPTLRLFLSRANDGCEQLDLKVSVSLERVAVSHVAAEYTLLFHAWHSPPITELSIPTAIHYALGRWTPKVGDVAVEKMGPASRQKSTTKRNGIINIDLGHARVRIEGAADPDCVRAALEGLVR
jgi:hypothetical protein